MASLHTDLYRYLPQISLNLLIIHQFDSKQIQAGIEAARFVRDNNATLYVKFWGLEKVYDDLIHMAELEKRMDRKQECAKFMELITETLPNSRVFSDSGSWIAQNHQTIEWQQIVCTDNMATLMRDFGLFKDLTKDQKRAMAIGCLRAAKLSSLAADGSESASAKLGMLRSQTQSTSALQQGTFLLSLLDVNSQASIVKKATSWEPKTKLGRFEREMQDLSKIVDEETKRDRQNRFLGILCVVGTLAILAW